MKPNVQINLTAAQAEVIHTALVHTRGTYLGTTERQIVSNIVEGLLPYRRPEQFAHRNHQDKTAKVNLVVAPNVYIISGS